MFSNCVTIPGYQVSEEISNGSRTIVYPGYRETDSLPVAMVMKNFGGISLKDYFDRNQTQGIGSLGEFLQIAIALYHTLDILYSQRIIYKDIKTSNILINPETKQVKLIDFSIASLLPRETQMLFALLIPVRQ